MKTDIRYSPSQCFDTFPLPGRLQVTQDARADRLVADASVGEERLSALESVMMSLSQWRREVMTSLQQGITPLYGGYHDPLATSPQAMGLRERHVELDHAVRDAYGWDDLDLGHGFHETRYGQFFTVSSRARLELLMRLLQLNFEQAAEQTGRSLESIMREAQQHV